MDSSKDVNFGDTVRYAPGEGRHVIDVEVSPGVEVYSFTFG